LRAIEFGERIRQADVPLFHEFSVQFPLAAAHRRAGHRMEAERIASFLANANLPLGWTPCARGEQWLLGKGGRSPRSVLECRRTPSKPFLDGILTDGCWKTSATADLKSIGSRAELGTHVLLAFDNQYLYVAADCQKAPGASYTSAAGSRPRDGDLTGRDRIDLLLDIDRDYTTYFRFSIDHRGWTNDACCDELAWNPKWHVAAMESEQTWAFEAAIPLAELGWEPAEQHEVWGIGLQRATPDGSSQSWPAATAPRDRLEGCGYVVFVAE
jgi:hypothetical protein